MPNAMNTQIVVKAILPLLKSETKTTLLIERVIKKWESIADAHNPTSELYMLNTATQYPVHISDNLQHLLATGISRCQETGGTLDITIKPLLDVWGWGIDTAPSSIPSTDALNRARQYVNYRSVRIASNSIWLPAGVELDPGAFAKGYIVDRIAETLQSNGIHHAFINAGGDIYFIGGKQFNHPWVVSIRHPRRHETGIPFVAYLAVQNRAVVTSGDYERVLHSDNSPYQYHHILNPATGYPAHPCVSVTVTAPTCVDADAYATAVFVMGPKRGMAFLTEKSNVEGFIIYNKNDTLKYTMTQGFSNMLIAPITLTHDRISQ